MNKARKRRQRRRERDLRWVALTEYKNPLPHDSHRGRKVFGQVPPEGKKRGAFWNPEVDDAPLFARLYFGAANV